MRSVLGQRLVQAVTRLQYAVTVVGEGPHSEYARRIRRSSQDPGWRRPGPAGGGCEAKAGLFQCQEEAEAAQR